VLLRPGWLQGDPRGAKATPVLAAPGMVTDAVGVPLGLLVVTRLVEAEQWSRILIGDHWTVVEAAEHIATTAFNSLAPTAQ